MPSLFLILDWPSIHRSLPSKSPDGKLDQYSVSGFFVWAGLLWHMGIGMEITGVPREPEGPPQGYDRHGRVSSGQDRHARGAYRRQ